MAASADLVAINIILVQYQPNIMLIYEAGMEIVKMGRIERAVLVSVLKELPFEKTPQACRAVNSLLRKGLLLKEDSKLFATTRIEDIAFTDKDKNKARAGRRLAARYGKKQNISVGKLYALRNLMAWMGDRFDEYEQMNNKARIEGGEYKVFRSVRIMKEATQLHPENHEAAVACFFEKIDD
jgi:hypothetical protein